jgi:pyrophosphatase PpaX
MKEYSYYLFDVDGTLIDTTELIFQCFLYTCKKFGSLDVTREQVVTNIGLTLRRQLEVYFGSLNDDRFTYLAGEHMNYQLSIYKKYLRAFPGVAECLGDLRRRGKHCGVVTSRRRQTLDLYLKETGLFDFFEVFVTPENTQKHKPDPEPVLEALALMSVADKTDALMIGDSEFDMESGLRAGVDTAFVKWGGVGPLSLRTTPTWIIDDFRQLYTPAV